MNATPESLRLSGPVGELEAALEVPAEPSAIAVICHPHPLQGGTMHNKVVTTLARTLQGLGHATLRFNYRGVGASAGDYGEIIGETADALAAIDWMRNRFKGLPLTLAGFSFGGVVAVRAAAQVLRRRQAEFARTMALEMGKPIVQGEAEVEKCAWACDYYADHAADFLAPQLRETDAAKSYVRFDPLGVVLAVMPWEFYESLIETLEVLSDPEMTAALRNSLDDLKQGRLLPHEEAQKRLGV